MKSLIQHISEKLVLTNNSKIKKHDSTFLDNFKWDIIILDTYSEKFDLDLTEIDFTQNTEAFEILEQIYKVGGKTDLTYFFYYLENNLTWYIEDGDKITEELLLSEIVNADLGDFEDWIERLK
jgi:hypothetical protein